MDRQKTNRYVEFRTGEMVFPCSSLPRVGVTRDKRAAPPHPPPDWREETQNVSRGALEVG